MMIDKIGGINPNQIKKTNIKAINALETSQQIGDYKVNISAEANQAKLKAESYKLAETLKTQTDTSREELVQSVKEKVDNDEYQNLTDKQLDQLADSLQNRFLGL